MENLSIVQALYIWSELEKALHGTNTYGGDTAEIYMYCLMPRSPMVEDHLRSGTDFLVEEGIEAEVTKEAVTQANVSLFNLLSHFAKKREVGILIDGTGLGPWLKKAWNDHRVHVRIVHKKKLKLEKG